MKKKGRGERKGREEDVHMNVTGTLRRSIRSKMGIRAYAPGASICAVYPTAVSFIGYCVFFYVESEGEGEEFRGVWDSKLTNTILSTPLHHACPIDIRM